MGEGRAGVRVIAATRHNLEDQVRAGRLREDLFHRLVAYRQNLILEAVRQTGGKASLACQVFGISRQTFDEKLSKHGLRLDRHRNTPSTWCLIDSREVTRHLRIQ